MLFHLYTHTHTHPPWQKSTRAASVLSRILGSYIQTNSLLRVKLFSVHMFTPWSSSSCNYSVHVRTHTLSDKRGKVFAFIFITISFIIWTSEHYMWSPCFICVPGSGGQTAACNTPSARGGVRHRSSEGGGQRLKDMYLRTYEKNYIYN